MTKPDIDIRGTMQNHGLHRRGVFDFEGEEGSMSVKGRAV